METKKMLDGKIYDSADKILEKMRAKAHKLSMEYNKTYEDDEKKRVEILKELLPNMGSGTYLQGPIQFDYGEFTTFGEKCYANFNLTILDCAKVTFGSNVFIGPNCTFATAMHPMLARERMMTTREDGSVYTLEYAKPINIGDGCWFGSNIVVCAGVNIGENTVIGAGSVVTRDLPSGVLAAGNPCKVIRKITEDESVKLREDLW